MRLRTWTRIWLSGLLVVLGLLNQVVSVALVPVVNAGKAYSVYTPVPLPSGYYGHPELVSGTYSPLGPGPAPGPSAPGVTTMASTSSIMAHPNLVTTTTRYVVPSFISPSPPGPGPRRIPYRHPPPQRSHFNPGRSPHPRGPPPPHMQFRPHPPPQVFRHGRTNVPNPSQKTNQDLNWIPMPHSMEMRIPDAVGMQVHQNPYAHGSMPIQSTTMRPPSAPVTGYISFDQWPSTSMSTSTSTSVSTSVSKSVGSAQVKMPATTSTTGPPTTAAPATTGSEKKRKRRKGKKRTTSTTTTTTTTVKPPRVKNTPEFQVPNPVYDYDSDYDLDLDYAMNNVLKRSPYGAASAPATESSSSSRRPTLLQRIESPSWPRKNAAVMTQARLTKSKSQQQWADRHTSTLPSHYGHGHDDDEIKKVISTELRKTHLSKGAMASVEQDAPQRDDGNGGGEGVAPIWRVTRVETSMNYTDSGPGANELVVLPYDGGSHFEGMRADRPTVNYVDLVTGESFNPYANSTPPITGDLYNSDGKQERKHIQHQLLYDDETGFRESSKLPENKTVDFDDTLSHDPKEVPVEPDFKKTRLRLKKKHPLLNQDSIISAEQSVTKNGLEISTDAFGTRRRSTTPMTPTTSTTTQSPWSWITTTFRPYTTSRIILTTRRPSSFTTEILNSWNSPTRTSTYSTTTARPAEVTTRRNPATTPAFTTGPPTSPTPSWTTRKPLSTITTPTRPPSTSPVRKTTIMPKPTTTRSTTTTTAAPPQPSQVQATNNELLDLFTLLGQTNTNSGDGSTTQANIFGFGQQQQQDLQSQLSLLESLLQGTQTLFPTTSTSTTTEHTSTTSIANDPATLSDSEIKSFLNILGVSPSTEPSTNTGPPQNIQAVIEQQAPTPPPTLSTQFVAPSPLTPSAPTPTAQAPVQRPHPATTAAPSLSAALSNMLAVLSNPFAPQTTTVAPPIEDNNANNAAILAALLTPQNNAQNNNANSNGGQQNLLSQILQLGNSLDPNTGNTAQNTRQVEATTPSSTTARAPVPVTRVPSLFDFSSLLGTGGIGTNAGGGGTNWFSNLAGNNLLAQPTTTTSNPLAALLDLNRLLFRNNNNNIGGGFGNLFGTQTATTVSPFANLFNFNSLLAPTTTTQAPAPAPLSVAANSPIEFHIPTTKRPHNPGPYFWLDMNTFFGGGAGPNDGLRPKVGSRDPFIRV